jgi:hypothetical protein
VGYESVARAGSNHRHAKKGIHAVTDHVKDFSLI